MSPTHGQPGTSITLSGTDFKSSATIKISFNDVVAASAVTDRSGAFTVVFAAPSSPNGTYPISVSDGVNTVNLAFTIDSSPTTTTTSTSTSNSTSSTTSSTKPAKTTTVTTTVTATVTTTSVTKVTTTSTTTVTSLSTSTVTGPAVTVTSTSTSTSIATKNYTTTEPAAPITATTTVTQVAKAVTMTVSASKSSADPPATPNSPQPSGGFSGTSLYFLAGVGILVTAISIGMLAFRERRIEDYGRDAPGHGSST